MHVLTAPLAAAAALALLASLPARAAEPGSRPGPRPNPQPRPAAAPAPRPYSLGPLTRNDFQALPPERLPVAGNTTIRASTFTELTYSYRYRYEVAEGRYKAVATEVRFEAIIWPEKSWNLQPDNPRLLEHEQGHFDISQWYALQGQQKFDPLMRQEAIRASAASEAEARLALENALKRQFDPLLAEWRAAQVRYDDETLHGTDTAAQRQWRATLDERLSQLSPEQPATRKPAGR